MCHSNSTNQITDISTLRLTRKLRNFVHVISMQSSGAVITLSDSGSGQIRWQIFGRICIQCDRPDFKNLNLVLS